MKNVDKFNPELKQVVLHVLERLEKKYPWNNAEWDDSCYPGTGVRQWAHLKNVLQTNQIN